MKKTYKIDKVGASNFMFEAIIVYEHYLGMAGCSSFEEVKLYRGSISNCMAIIEADKRGYLTDIARDMAYQVGQPGIYQE